MISPKKSQKTISVKPGKYSITSKNYFFVRPLPPKNCNPKILQTLSTHPAFQASPNCTPSSHLHPLKKIRTVTSRSFHICPSIVSTGDPVSHLSRHCRPRTMEARPELKETWNRMLGLQICTRSSERTLRWRKKKKEGERKGESRFTGIVQRFLSIPV